MIARLALFGVLITSLNGCLYCGCEGRPDNESLQSPTDELGSSLLATVNATATNHPTHPLRFADSLSDTTATVTDSPSQLHIYFSVANEPYKITYDIGELSYEN